MSPLAYLLLLLITPFQTVQSPMAERLAVHIVSVQFRAWSYARPLARSILREAEDHGLDPAVLAGIGWMESWYYMGTKGNDGERGIWQLYPRPKRWREIEWSTRAAARKLVIFERHCHRKRHDHRRPTDWAAHYNSGYRWPRAAYMWVLWNRVKIIRRKLNQQ